MRSEYGSENHRLAVRSVRASGSTAEIDYISKNRKYVKLAASLVGLRNAGQEQDTVVQRPLRQRLAALPRYFRTFGFLTAKAVPFQDRKTFWCAATGSGEFQTMRFQLTKTPPRHSETEKAKAIANAAKRFGTQ